jgi:iron complex transport system substrate-binding protein
MIAMRSGMLSLLAAPPSAAEVAFTDQRGKLVTLDRPAGRVVAFPKPAPSLYIAVDEGIEHLVRIHPAAQSTIMNSVLGKVFRASPRSIPGSSKASCPMSRSC